MSKWEQTLSQRRKRLQESTKVEPLAGSNPLTDLLEFCESIDFTPESPELEDFVTEMEALLSSGALSEDNSGRLQTMLETFKKMIFKMLDKTKKTVTAKTPDEDDEDDEVTESRAPSIRSLVEMGKLISLTGPTPSAPKSGDAAKLCKDLTKAVAPMVQGKFFKCRQSTRFASVSGVSVEVRYADISPSPSDLEWHNAKMSMHLNIDGFDAEGNMTSDKLKLQVYTRRGNKIRAKTGSPAQIVKHIAAAIKSTKS